MESSGVKDFEKQTPVHFDSPPEGAVANDVHW
jgi:hypothetical protein